MKRKFLLPPKKNPNFLQLKIVFDNWILRWIIIIAINFPHTVGSKIIRALAIMLAFCLWFDCQFLSFHAYKQHKAYRLWPDKYLFHKAALGISFLTRIISNARIKLLVAVPLSLSDGNNHISSIDVVSFEWKEL